MDFIEWSESMSVGIPLIDQDHKVIIKLINLFHQQLSTGQDSKILGSALNTLIDYTLFHFSREERVMQTCNYPGLDEHKLQHQKLERQVADIAHRFHENTDNVNKDELLEFLKQWLINHILKKDMGFRPYCEDHAEVKVITASMQKKMRLEQEQEQEPDTKTLIPLSINLNSISVLIVSQNESFCLMIKTILEMANVMKIHQASRVTEVNQILKKFTPDLIIYRPHKNDLDLQKIANYGISLLIVSPDENSAQLAIEAKKMQLLEEPIGIHLLFEAIIKIIK